MCHCVLFSLRSLWDNQIEKHKVKNGFAQLGLRFVFVAHFADLLFVLNSTFATQHFASSLIMISRTSPLDDCYLFALFGTSSSFASFSGLLFCEMKLKEKLSTFLCQLTFVPFHLENSFFLTLFIEKYALPHFHLLGQCEQIFTV